MNDITALMATMKAVAEKATEFGEERLYVKAGSVLALVEALEKAQQKNTELNQRNTALTAKIEPMDRRIAELEEIATDYGMKFQRAQDDLKKMALMESRTVTVKLPEVRITVAESRRKNLTWRELGAYNEGADVAAEKISKVLVAAGIQVIEGEGQ